MKTFARLALASLVTLSACVDMAPGGLGPAPHGNGPVVRFDMAHGPLPDVPLPNDVLASADPTSRTGRRLNLSLLGATSLESQFREGFASLEGWGTTAPITVSFDRAAGAGADEAALDLADVAGRMANDDFDPTNDPFYVVDLTTGLPALLDVGSGAYPTAPAGKRLVGEDGDTSWYERSTDTLILRPMIPLEEKRTYAVVLTDRLRSSRGEPVRSPFATIHHPAQRRDVARLEQVLSDAKLAGVYGDLAGTGLSRVTFAWSFTTEPTHEDLRLLRAGLHGEGPFARFADVYAPNLRVREVAGPCDAGKRHPYVVSLATPEARAAVRDVVARALSLDAGESASLEASLAFVDHLVVGVFRTPYLLGEPAFAYPTGRFAVDYRTGAGRVRPDEVDFLLAVPKPSAAAAQPFPVAVHTHSEGKSPVEALLHAGTSARQGIATFALTAPEHGLDLRPEDVTALSASLQSACAGPFLGALLDGRARNPRVGSVARGFQTWASHPFHARDVTRQAALEAMQAVRALRELDGHVGEQDFDANGTPDVAGDFDGDGRPDVGGPGVAYFATGTSFGGMVATLAGAVDSDVVAAVPVAAGGNLALDVAFRARIGTTLQLTGPEVVAVPAAERAGVTSCAPDQRSVRLVVATGSADEEIEVACFGASELDASHGVVVTNVSTREERCAIAGDGGRFVLPIAATLGDQLDVQVYPVKDALLSLATCDARPGAPVGRRVQTFELAGSAAEAGTTLFAPADGLGLRAGSPELRRYRDLVQTAVDAGDPAALAPFYAVRPFADEQGARTAPRALLATVTTGDEIVPVAAGVALARAAGSVPFLPPRALASMPAYADDVTPGALFDALGGRTPERVLVESNAILGLSELGLSQAGPACGANVLPSATCTAPTTPSPETCAHALVDVDVVNGGRPWDAPRLPVPLRVARVAGADVHVPGGLEAAWEPRLRGAPGTPDSAAWSAHAPVVALHLAYVDPLGAHGFDGGDVCRAWDFAEYEDALAARFLATRGADLYYSSHPETHTCLEHGTCPFLP